jgi:hypothetical protein
VPKAVSSKKPIGYDEGKNGAFLLMRAGLDEIDVTPA